MYSGIYKCRLCGKEYVRCVTGNSDIVVRHFIGLITTQKEPQQVDLIDMHSCDNGGYGLADFQGFRYDTE